MIIGVGGVCEKVRYPGGGRGLMCDVVLSEPKVLGNTSTSWSPIIDSIRLMKPCEVCIWVWVGFEVLLIVPGQVAMR